MNTWASVATAMRSWRTAAVALLSISSGLPLGLVWYAIPDWMRDSGVDLRFVGLFTLAQTPWAFKVVWSPLMDRYVPPFWGRRRGWIALTQLALALLGLLLAGVGNRPEAVWVVGALALAIALASASQDIAVDAYAVDVLRPEEQGSAAGARVAFYRLGMLVSGGAAISAAARVGWPAVNVLLAVAYLGMLLLTWKAPEPDAQPPPPSTLREAVWQPLVGFLVQPRALEILAFVFFYKFADQLAQALTRPFLIDMGYGADHRGIALAGVSAVATVAGAVVGGWATTLTGLGHALWTFGFLQLLSNVGYFFLALLDGPSPPLMYSAASFELFTSGLGTGAFSVLLLRLTQKRFSATQYALFSSLFALPRVVAGPVTGLAVEAVGWPAFFLSTIAMGIPGLLLLARFVPLGTREPTLVERVQPRPTRLSGAGPIAYGSAGGLAAALGAWVTVALGSAVRARQASPSEGLDFAAALWRVGRPAHLDDWIALAGIVAFAVIVGLSAGAWASLRRTSDP